MAELKLSAIWNVKDFVQKFNTNTKSGECFECCDFAGLCHESLKDLKWKTFLYICLCLKCREKSFASFLLEASSVTTAVKGKYLWREFNATLLDSNGCDVFTYKVDRFSDLSTANCWRENHSEVFSCAMLSKAVSDNDALRIRIDLTILDLIEVLKCRELLRGFLTNSTLTDFDVNVKGERFKLHKSVLAESSTVFARMLESGMEEAVDGVLTLPDTTPAAFKAFVQAIYFDSWDFLSNVDLTQDVLFLAEKYNVGDLKHFCDDSLAKKVTDANALEILTKSAALCNAEKTQAACIEILAEKMDFKESIIWLDFKKRNRGVALEILDVVGDKWIAACKRLKGKLDVANAELKRKCEQKEEKASGSKRGRK